MTINKKMKNRNLNIMTVLLSAAAFGFMYWEAFYGMVMDWYNDDNYSHGFLIPIISGYLLLQSKDEMKRVELRTSVSGIPILLAGLALFLIGHLSSEFFTSRVSMLVVLAGTLLFVCGTELFKIIAFPFFYLIFMIPLPYMLYDAFAFPLKLFVSAISVEFLDMIGILVLREGNIINLAEVTLEVADACSGIRSIISLLALSTALAYFTQRGWIKKSVCIMMAVPIALLVNAVRVIGTGILADMYGAGVAEGFFHDFAGLAVFGVAIVLLVLAAVLLNRMSISDKGDNE